MEGGENDNFMNVPPSSNMPNSRYEIRVREEAEIDRARDATCITYMVLMIKMRCIHILMRQIG